MWEVSKFNASFRSSSVFDQRLAGWRLVELEVEVVRTLAGVFLFDVLCFDHFGLHGVSSAVLSFGTRGL